MDNYFLNNIMINLALMFNYINFYKQNIFAEFLTQLED